MLTTELIERILTQLPLRTIGLLGDLFLDRYLDIDPARDEPSVETGLTAYQVVGVRNYPGALGTVLNNLVALGVGRIVPIAAIGDDGEGYELQKAFTAMKGVDAGGVLAAPGRRTPTYTKPMYGEKELNRLDIKNRTPTPDTVQDSILRKLDEAWPLLDGLIVLDQVSESECGVVTRRIRDRLADLAAADRGKFVLADSREQIGSFRNVCVKPNRRECIRAVEPNQHDFAILLKCAGSLADRVSRPVFCTDGDNGIFLVHPAADWKTAPRIPAFPVHGPIDICGAGDSCSAGIATAMVCGASFEEAASFGNLVASITIQQIGVTGVASPDQVRTRWQEVSTI